MRPSPVEARRILAESRFVSALPDELVERMLEAMVERHYEKGAAIIRQEDPGESLLVVAQGEAVVRLRDDAGAEHEVGRVQRGDLLGEMALVTGERRSADVVATTAVRVFALPAEAFHTLAGRYPDFAVMLSKLIAERLGGRGPDILGDKVLQGYRIRRSVGQGAMSVVYEAEALDSGRVVALKMMSHRLVYRASALKRFREEADLGATLEHENIVRLHTRFSAYGTHFLVLEYLDGPGLDRVIDRHGALPEPVVRGVIGQLAGALAYVHGRGLIHRDVKASNVRFTRDGVAKLMDFGLSRPTLKMGDRTETHEMRLIGTPIYMAPEQFDDADLDHRVDVYGLGCLAYRLLTGSRPFMGSSLIALIKQKSTFRMPARDTLKRPVSDDLYEFVERCMRPDRDDRYDSLSAFAEWAAPVDPSLLDV